MDGVPSANNYQGGFGTTLMAKVRWARRLPWGVGPGVLKGLLLLLFALPSPSPLALLFPVTKPVFVLEDNSPKLGLTYSLGFLIPAFQMGIDWDFPFVLGFLCNGS